MSSSPIRGSAPSSFYDSSLNPFLKTGEEIIDAFMKKAEEAAAKLPWGSQGGCRERANQHIESLKAELSTMKDLNYTHQEIQTELETLADAFYSSLTRHEAHAELYKTEHQNQETKNLSLTQRLAQATMGILGLAPTQKHETSLPPRPEICNLPIIRQLGPCFLEITAIPSHMLPDNQIKKALDQWDEGQEKIALEQRPKYVKKLEEAQDRLLKEKKRVEQFQSADYSIRIEIEKIDQEIEDEFKPKRQFQVRK